MDIYEEFTKALAKDPTLIDQLRKSQGLSEFKEQYNVERTSGLKCPVCAAFFQFPGSLWYKPTIPTHFVCRKCHLEFDIKCLTLTNVDLLRELKDVSKGVQAFPSWMKGDTKGEE